MAIFSLSTALSDVCELQHVYKAPFDLLSSQFNSLYPVDYTQVYLILPLKA